MSRSREKKELNQKKAKEVNTPLFTGLNMKSFTEDDLNSLNDLFNVLASDKRLAILETTVFNSATRLKDLASKLGGRNSAQIAIHAKKLHDSGFLRKEGASLRDSREYIPTIPEVTYIFLRLSLIYTKILQSRRTELKLEKLKEVAETAKEAFETSPIQATTVKLSRIPAQYEESIKLAHTAFQKLLKQFTKIINLVEL
jgi:hypothetical protein